MTILKMMSVASLLLLGLVSCNTGSGHGGNMSDLDLIYSSDEPWNM